ncbi:N-6 DNA methylase [Prevotella communis]|uniref:N-6 DNA methylase n=1 Tax=Prevotella communis TaxID=2913614 RepID=UPI001EDA62B0|nr:N-6 DNA methylase [Prevotella communis]UKK61699.1 N-6 DNA methylase [Prevotella communis]UKK64525.1 N-6 DNA methylase [Prevotella communis]
MIQDLTKDEMLWRYANLMDFIINEIEKNGIEKLPEDKDVDYLNDLISGSLVYLQKAGAISIILNNDEKVGCAMFTASREECIKTSWIEPDEDEITYGDRPNNKKIPVPVLFDEKGNEKYTKISLVFNFPNSNIGRLCKRMIAYLRNSCKEDVNVINSVVFLKYCVKEEFYISCLRRLMLFAFVDDHWTSSLQIPTEVDDIIAMVMEDEAQDVYDPFMRTGLNLFYARGKYHAQATNKYYMYATMLWAGVMGFDTEHIEYADCVSSWDATDCDFIIVTPEFDQEVVTSNGETESISSFSLEKVLGSMNVENRRAILLLPASALTSNGKTAKLRHDITEANLLDTVVLLPANVFNKTSIAATIIYLKTGRKQGDPITFVDLSSFVKDKDEYEELQDEEKDTIDIDKVKEVIDKIDKMYINEVPVNDVKEREYEWYVPNYMDSVTQVPAGYRKEMLSEILEPMEEDGMMLHSGYIVREEYLASNPFEEYEQNPKLGKRFLSLINHEDKEDDAEEDADIYDVYKGSPFVVQYGEKELKTYYHEFVTNFDLFRNVSVPKSCAAYRINPDLIDVNYLRLLLAQIDKESNGELRRNGIKRWSGGKGIDPVLLIPLSLEEQRRIYEDAKLNAAVEKARKEGLDKAIDSMKQEYMMEVRMRKHDMKPFLSQLDSQAKLITFYLDKIEGNNELVSSIRQKLTGISNAVSELRLHLNRLTEEDIYGSPEVMNPLEILNELTGTFSNYSVALEVDMVALKEAKIDTPEIFISKVDFSTLATTIIENAVTHAFTGEGVEYKVLITLSYNANKDVFTIDFKNDGNPMPQGMDKFRYGLKGEKGAKSHGTGLGGYRVKSITRHYKGDYDVFCNRTQKTTTIRVMFPKYNSHE